MSFSKKHPECREDEVFVSNVTESQYSDIGWRTKRRGNVAYGIDGKPIGDSREIFPVFVKKKEIHDRDPEILKRLEA